MSDFITVFFFTLSCSNLSTSVAESLQMHAVAVNNNKLGSSLLFKRSCKVCFARGDHKFHNNHKYVELILVVSWKMRGLVIYFGAQY